MKSSDNIRVKDNMNMLILSSDSNDLKLNAYLKNFKLYHLIQDAYTDVQLEIIMSILNQYINNSNMKMINYSSSIAASWWTDFLATPILKDESMLKTCLKLLISWRGIYQYDNSIDQIMNFEKNLASLIKTKLLYTDEIIIDQNSEIMKEALLISDCVNKNKTDLKMSITKNEVILWENNKCRTLYYNYEKIKKK